MRKALLPVAAIFLFNLPNQVFANNSMSNDYSLSLWSNTTNNPSQSIPTPLLVADTDADTDADSGDAELKPINPPDNTNSESGASDTETNTNTTNNSQQNRPLSDGEFGLNHLELGLNFGVLGNRAGPAFAFITTFDIGTSFYNTENYYIGWLLEFGGGGYNVIDQSYKMDIDYAKLSLTWTGIALGELAFQANLGIINAQITEFGFSPVDSNGWSYGFSLLYGSENFRTSMISYQRYYINGNAYGSWSMSIFLLTTMAGNLSSQL